MLQKIKCFLGFHSDTLQNCQFCGKWVCKHPSWVNADFFDEEHSPYPRMVAARRCAICGLLDSSDY